MKQYSNMVYYTAFYSVVLDYNSYLEVIIFGITYRLSVVPCPHVFKKKSWLTLNLSKRLCEFMQMQNTKSKRRNKMFTYYFNPL